MKTTRKSFLIIGICLLQYINVYGQEETIWDYPIKPKTEEWKNLENNKSKVDVCQIPQNILSNISTNDLMTICLQYPLLYDVFAFNNTKDGLGKLFSDFNGIRELSKKGNSIGCLVQQYVSEINKFSDILDSSKLEIGHAIVRISILEVLMSYFEFHNNTTEETQKQVLENLLFGYREKCKYPEYFRGHGFTTNLFARANIIVKIDTALSEEFENKTVLFSGMADANLIDIIDNLSYNLIK